MYKSSFITMTLLVFILSSCQKDDSSHSSTSSNVQQGTWRITLYTDSGTDETYHFTGYSFSFESNGTAKANKDTSVVNGNWHIETDDHHQELYVHFGTAIPLHELNDDWDILEQTANKIKLTDISGGNEPDDLLTFEKN